MLRLLTRLVLMALGFAFLLPQIPGVTFHGTFFQALLLSILFSIILFLVDIAAVAFSAAAAIRTFGMALLWLIPVWIFGFWLLPALALKVVSEIAPSYLTMQGWLPAVLSGLIMMIIGMATSGSLWKQEQY